MADGKEIRLWKIGRQSFVLGAVEQASTLQADRAVSVMVREFYEYLAR